MFLTRDPIRAEEFLDGAVCPQAGAAVVFLGRVRNHHLGRPVKSLVYSCYESMAEKKLKQIRDETMERFPVAAIRLRHRVGALEIGEIAVAIEVLSAHRDEAYDASREMIERVKTEVPIWKKEFYTDGTSAWTLCEHVRQPGRGKRRCHAH